MDKHYSQGSHGNPVIVVFAVFTVIGIKYGYVSNPDWYILAYFSLPMLLVSFIVFRKRPSVERTKRNLRQQAARRGSIIGII